MSAILHLVITRAYGSTEACQRVREELSQHPNTSYINICGCVREDNNITITDPGTCYAPNSPDHTVDFFLNVVKEWMFDRPVVLKGRKIIEKLKMEHETPVADWRMLQAYAAHMLEIKPAIEKGKFNIWTDTFFDFDFEINGVTNIANGGTAGHANDPNDPSNMFYIVIIENNALRLRSNVF